MPSTTKVVRRGKGLCLLTAATVIATGAARAEDAIPNLVGTWSGENLTISDKKGYGSWKKTIHITEQKDRRFRGHFKYSAGRKDFFGVVHPDNVTVTWVAADSKGYNLGKLIGPERLSACYVESWEEATAGCTDLTLTSRDELPK